MQLFDKDLLSVQEVRDLMAAAKAAQAELAEKSQEEVDKIVKSIADAGVRNAARLAVMANEETGFGIVIVTSIAEGVSIENVRVSGKVSSVNTVAPSIIFRPKP